MKSVFFVEHVFFMEIDNKPYIKFYMNGAVLCIYLMIPRMLCFGEAITNFEATGISHCFEALCSVQSSIQPIYTSRSVSFDRYTFHRYPYKIWRWFIHFGFEKQGNLSQTCKVCKKKKFYSVSGVYIFYRVSKSLGASQAL
jgi:K+ transporter